MIFKVMESYTPHILLFLQPQIQLFQIEILDFKGEML